MSTETSVPSQRNGLAKLGAADTNLLSALLKRAPVGFAFFAPDLSFQRVNATLAQVYGLEEADCLGRRPSEVLPAGAGAAHEAALRRVLDGESAANGSHRTPGEPVQHWSLSWFPSHDDDGVIDGIAMIAIDVTDQRAAEEDVRRSEERYRSLVQASTQVIWVAAPDGQIREDSPEWRAITGQDLPEYLGDGWMETLHPDDLDRVRSQWRQAVATRTSVDTRFRVRTRNGGYRSFESHAVPIIRGGEVVEWVGANTDVTQQREADEMRQRLTQQLSEAALRTARLQQATSQLAEALTVSEVVRVIGEVGVASVGVDRAAVALLDRERLRLRLVNPEGVPDVPGAPAPVQALDVPSVMTIAVNERRPVIVEDPEQLRRLLESSPDAEDFLAHTDERAWVGLPLLAAGSVLGALRFSFGHTRRISDEERVFLEALAGQCALAVERAQMYEREHSAAETLQLSLLPDTLPDVAGLRFGRMYRSGTQHVQVGGDWYDAFVLPDGRLAGVVGDVMGKGLKAAAGMSRVRNALRALAYADPDPGAVLSGLDRVFTATEREDQVATLAYFVLDPATGEGVYASAGHPPPLLLGGGGAAELFAEEAGTPLGVPNGGEPYEGRGFTMPPGSTLVLYSDGLVENRKRGVGTGLDTLVTVGAAAPADQAGDPDRLIEYLVERMLAGYEQDDDVTLLAVHIPIRDN
ncbi:SpoIIE family protein phosphatase [Allonocardiopsis opalescens]|uniref:PAS domain S-box-containing protein n=1 Tax=Allonocardiopsis opalescens TaxID=1144618 RepID=A0A2T0Q0W3_9ACTN|nr:SpoIIE family protein phosphatase [Allonocardiopsis opalescens]PRX97355.1 PAS domain S-box-containing protein [Allonocardiopsis opalescens]